MLCAALLALACCSGPLRRRWAAAARAGKLQAQLAALARIRQAHARARPSSAQVAREEREMERRLLAGECVEI